MIALDFLLYALGILAVALAVLALRKALDNQPTRDYSEYKIEPTIWKTTRYPENDDDTGTGPDRTT